MKSYKDKSRMDEQYFQCSLCKKKESVRKNSFFLDIKLDFHVIFKIMDLWLDETPICLATEKTNISKPTIIKIYKNLRNVLGKYLEQNPPVIGGNGNIVQIDETVIAKRKHNRGRIIPQKWVVGAIDTVSKDIIIRHLDNRSRDELRNVICDAITESCTVTTDLWRGYLNIFENRDITHNTVNHSENFVDPITGAHTNSIENVWSHLKQSLRRKYQRRSTHLQSYIDEFLWRKKLKNKEEMITSLIRLMQINTECP
jgi:IS1 family transposase